MTAFVAILHLSSLLLTSEQTLGSDLEIEFTAVDDEKLC